MQNTFSFKKHLELCQNNIYYWQTFAEYRIMLRQVEVNYMPNLKSVTYLPDHKLLQRKQEFEEKLEHYFKSMMFEQDHCCSYHDTEILKGAIQNRYLDTIEQELECRGLLYHNAHEFLSYIFEN